MAPDGGQSWVESEWRRQHSCQRPKNTPSHRRRRRDLAQSPTAWWHWTRLGGRRRRPSRWQADPRKGRPSQQHPRARCRPGRQQWAEMRRKGVGSTRVGEDHARMMRRLIARKSSFFSNTQESYVSSLHYKIEVEQYKGQRPTETKKRKKKKKKKHDTKTSNPEKQQRASMWVMTIN